MAWRRFTAPLGWRKRGVLIVSCNYWVSNGAKGFFTYAHYPTTTIQILCPLKKNNNNILVFNFSLRHWQYFKLLLSPLPIKISTDVKKARRLRYVLYWQLGSQLPTTAYDMALNGYHS
jgi:hypothetical protein